MASPPPLWSATRFSIRRFHSFTRPVRQHRGTAAAGRGSAKWSVKPSSPTFRPPSQNLLSPFGSVLHGPTRGPQAAFAEPLDAWLAVLADTVPFYKDCLLVCPSTATAGQVQRVWHRCREHIPTAHVGTLRPRSAVRGMGSIGSAAAAKPAEALSLLPEHKTTSSGSQLSHEGKATTQEGAAPLHTSSPLPVSPGTPAAATPALSSDGALVCPSAPRRTSQLSTTRPLPSLHSPLEDVTPGSLDLVVFPLNVFASEMLFDAPWHLSLAHRALRPHGVVAIIGHVIEADVVAPDWAAASCAECVAGIHEEAQRDLELAALGVVRALPTAHAHVRRLQRAVEEQETLRTAHSDVFFPFPAVRRRWFTSEYALHPAQVVAHYRAAPLYQTLYGADGAMWRSRAAYALRQDAGREKKGGVSGSAVDAGTGEDLFVDVTGDLTSAAAGQDTASLAPPSFSLPLSSSTMSAGDDAFAAWSPLGVQRRRGVMDPLDALQAILEAHVAAGQPSPSARSRQRAPLRVDPPLRVQVRHFVVTCSSRSMNATSELPALSQGGGSRQQSASRTLPPSSSSSSNLRNPRPPFALSR